MSDLTPGGVERHTSKVRAPTQTFVELLPLINRSEKGLPVRTRPGRPLVRYAGYDPERVCALRATGLSAKEIGRLIAEEHGRWTPYATDYVRRIWREKR